MYDRILVLVSLVPAYCRCGGTHYSRIGHKQQADEVGTKQDDPEDTTHLKATREKRERSPGTSIATRHLVTPSVDARNVNGHVNHVAAQLVGGHMHRVEVSRNVNPRDYIEQERLLHHAVLLCIYQASKVRQTGRVGND